MNIRDSLTKEPPESANDSPKYLGATIRASYPEIRELPGQSLLAVSVSGERGVHVEFAVFSCVASCDDELENTYEILFTGDGTGSNLRECRHTFWGDAQDGYVFYPSPQVIAAAFEALKEWFDFRTW